MSNPAFRFLYDAFYLPSGLKVVPALIAEWLTPRALAYWIMDDGSWEAGSKAILLHANSFTLEDQQRLCSVLFTNFGISA